MLSLNYLKKNCFPICRFTKNLFVHRYLTSQSLLSETDTEPNAEIKETAKTKETKKKLFQGIESPNLTVDQVKQIKLITSIDVSRYILAWITCDEHGKVGSWNFQAFKEPIFVNRKSFESVYKQIYEVYEEHIKPQKSSAYLFESRDYRLTDLKLLPYVLHLQQHENILRTLIMSQGQGYQFTIDSSKLAKRFMLHIGTERVNSGRLVSQMLDRSDPTSQMSLHLDKKMALLKDSFLDVNKELREFYKSNPSDNKEALAKCYIQAAGFVNEMKRAQSRINA